MTKLCEIFFLKFCRKNLQKADVYSIIKGLWHGIRGSGRLPHGDMRVFPWRMSDSWNRATVIRKTAYSIMKKSGGILPLACVRLCNLIRFSTTRRPKTVFGIIYEWALNTRLGVLEKCRSITDKKDLRRKHRWHKQTRKWESDSNLTTMCC